MHAISTRQQGDLGELSAMEWLGSQGYTIYIPVGHSPTCDLIAERSQELLRVRVKTSRRFRKGRWEIALCTRGGNQSWSGIVKHLDPTRIDYLFVLVGDGRRWLIPADAIAGGTGILLGGPKYADFEVHSGQPLPRRDPAHPATSCGRYHRRPRRGSRAVKGEAL